MAQLISDKFGLGGKVAIITGTTRGLGESLAEALLDAGAMVAALDRSDNPYLKEYGEKKGASFCRKKIDLLGASPEEMEAVVSEVVDEWGGINILVNNAGITRRGEVQEFEDVDWQDVMCMNLTVPFQLSKIVSRFFMKKKRGKIINIASMLSYQGGMRVPSYVASKHGVVGLTRSFANGLARHGINVNAIAPGFMASDMTQPLQEDPERNKSILNRIAAGRWGTGEDLKGALIFLASEMSDYIHGSVISVDGGWLSM